MLKRGDSRGLSTMGFFKKEPTMVERGNKKGLSTMGFFKKEPTMVERGNKKGLSTIVATLLVILLAIVAIAIIWVVVRNVLQENSDQVSLGKFTVDMEISKADKINYSYISATVKRNPGKGEVSGIIFIASDKDNSEIIKYNISMKELEQRNFQLILYVINTSAVEKISIVPIFMRDSGKELIGNIADEWIFNLSKSGIGEIICTDTCLSLGYECGIQTVCEVVNTDCGPCSSGTCNPAGQCVVIRNLAWEPNSTINSSLLYIGSWSAPTVFYKDGSWYLIAGADASFKGFAWNGNQWVSNSTINASLPTITSLLKSSVFYKDGSWYLIAGEHDGRFFGFKLNGNNWESDPAIVSGLPNIGLKSYPAVFYKDSSWYLISGDYYGNFYGFAWNGNQWVTNLTINASLPDIGSYSRLSVFYKDSDWYLISGEDNGNFYGFVYT
jgi:hypothetical protein